MAFAPAVQAQPSSPFVTFESQLPALEQRPALDAWKQLQNPPGHWLSDPEYHYWRGVFALNAGQLIDARDSFERVLMIEPDHAGALYDYGFALCRLGERRSCLIVLEAARRQYGLPPALSRTRSNLLLAEIRTGAGFSSNLNRAPVRDILPVQLEGVSLNLQLGDELRPRSGAYVDTGADLRFVQLESGLKIGGSAYQRLAQGESGVVLLAGEIRYPVAERHQLGMQAYSMSEGGQRGLRASGGLWEWQPGGDWKRLALSVERRHLTESDARYTASRLDTLHQLRPDWSLGGFLEAEGRTERRAGVGSRRVGVTLAHQVGSTPLGWLESGLRLSHARDLAPYSALFGDVTRTLRQAELNLRLTSPLVGGPFDAMARPKLRTDLRAFAQRSNIALFDINEWQLQLSLVWEFQK